MNFSITPIAHIRSDFSSKFGIPRQSSLIDELEAEIIFEKADTAYSEYREDYYDSKHYHGPIK